MSAGITKTQKKVTINPTDDTQTKTETNCMNLVENEFEFLYDSADDTQGQNDLPYNTLNRFVINRDPVFEVFREADEVEQSHEDSNDSVDIPDKPTRLCASSSPELPKKEFSEFPSMASEVRLQSPGDLVDSKNFDTKIHGEASSHEQDSFVVPRDNPALEEDPISLQVHTSTNSADCRSLNLDGPSSIPEHPLADIKSRDKASNSDSFALSFKSKGNFRSYKSRRKPPREKTTKKKNGSFFSLRRSKSTTDVPELDNLQRTVEELKSRNEISGGKNKLKRSQSGVVEMPSAYDQLDEELRPGLAMNEKAKERKKRKRLKLLSRAQRLKKKGSTSKISIDDYLTASEYESEDEVCWIESPGYQVSSTPTQLDLELLSDVGLKAPTNSPNLSDKCQIHPSEDVTKLIRRVSFHADVMEIPNSLTVSASSDPQSQPTSPISDLIAPLSFHIPKIPDTSSQESLTTRPQSVETATAKPDDLQIAYQITDNEDDPFEEGISLIMEVDLGTTYLDTNTQEPCSADIGVQTSVKTISFGCGEDRVYSVSSGLESLDGDFSPIQETKKCQEENKGIRYRLF